MSRMAGDDCWLWYGLMTFSRTCTFIYIALVALLDRIQLSFSNHQYLNTHEPGVYANAKALSRRSAGPEEIQLSYIWEPRLWVQYSLSVIVRNVITGRLLPRKSKLQKLQEFYVVWALRGGRDVADNSGVGDSGMMRAQWWSLYWIRWREDVKMSYLEDTHKQWYQCPLDSMIKP